MNPKRILIALLSGIILLLAIAFPFPSGARSNTGPFNLVAWDSGKYVQLSWDGEPAAENHGYNIYRSLKPDRWEKLNEEVFPLTTFVDYAAPRSEIVQYRINKISASGEEVPSASVVGVNTSGVVVNQF